MTTDRPQRLMEAWLDGAIDDAEFVELETALLESAEMRREFWRRASLHGLIREAVKISGGLPTPEPRDGGEVIVRPSKFARLSGLRNLWPAWLRGGLAAGAAIMLLGGLGLGSVVTSMAFAYAGIRGRDARAVVLHEEGFEKPPAPRQDFIPQLVDVWCGDETEVVGMDVERNVFPRSGLHMLRFISGHPRGANYQGQGSELWRIVDLETVRSATGSPDVTIEFSASFNGLAGADGISPEFWLSAIATNGEPSDLPQVWGDQFLYSKGIPSSLAAAQVRDSIDADPATWQRLTATLAVPRKARFLVLHCTAVMTEGDPAAAGAARQFVDDIAVLAINAKDEGGMQ